MGILFPAFSKHKKLYIALKNILGFYPKNISLYLLAFKHKSAGVVEKKTTINNERLEFLGDAVLGTVVAHYLFKTFPYKDEGFLTKMRSKIVSRTQLNLLARKMGIDELLDSNLNNKIKYSSINGDAFEALIGAIYLDKGYEKTKRFIIERVIKFHLNIDEIETKETDFKSKLVEWSQKEKHTLLFEVIEDPTAVNNMQFTVRITINGEEKSRAIHHSKKKAEQIAAEITCVAINI